MKLRYMKLRNYRKFRDSEMEFPDGVIGVIGPNGVGKSSLIEAIAWALYGNEFQITRTNKEGIRRAGADDNDECSVLLEFDMDGDSYRLFRGMRGKDLRPEAELEVNGRLTAEGDSAVSRAITKRLGMDYKSFFISVFARQKELNALSSLRPGERKRVVLRMLDVDVIEKVVNEINSDSRRVKELFERESKKLSNEEGEKKEELLKGELKDINEGLEGGRSELSGVKKRLQEHDNRIEELKERRSEVSDLRDRYEELKGELRELGSKLESGRSRVEELTGEIQSLEDRKEELGKLEERVEEYRTVKSSLEEKDEIKREYEKKKELQSRLDSLDRKEGSRSERVATLEEKIEDMEGVEKSISTVEETLTKIEERLSGKKSKIDLLTSEIRRMEEEREEKKESREEIQDLGPESSCPTCERPLRDHHGMLLRKLEDEIEELDEKIQEDSDHRDKLEEEVSTLKKRRKVLEERKKNLTEKQRRLSKLEGTLEQASERLKEIKEEKQDIEDKMNEMGEVDFIPEEYESLIERRDELEDAQEKYREISVQLKRLPALKEKRESIIKEVSSLRERSDELQGSIQELDYGEGDLKEVQEELEGEMKKRNRVNERFRDIKEGISLKKKDREQTLERLDELRKVKKEVDKLSTEVEELSTLGDAMKDFWKNVMSRIIPTLSDISSSLFTEMTDSKYEGLDLDENYDIHIYDQGEKYPLERFSGGEVDLANLCLRLAISRVIADRSGSGVDLLILDEIFGSQDQNRKRNVMNSLNHLSNQFSQIILITHIADVKDFMSNVMYLREQEDGTSEIMLEA